MQRVVRFCKALRQGAEPRRGVRAPHFGALGSQGAPMFAGHGHCKDTAAVETSTSPTGQLPTQACFQNAGKGAPFHRPHCPQDGGLSQRCCSAWKLQVMNCVSLKLAFQKVRMMQTPSTVRGDAFALVRSCKGLPCLSNNNKPLKLAVFFPFLLLRKRYFSWECSLTSSAFIRAISHAASPSLPPLPAVVFG